MVLTVILFCFGISYAGSGTIKIRLDGTELTGDSPPVIVNGRTLVPARLLFESMGGAVTWDSATREVTVNINKDVIKLKVGSNIAYVNDVKKEIDVSATIKNNRTMIPVRFVAEAAGCKVAWDNANRVVDITSPDTAEYIAIQKIKITGGKTVQIDADREIKDYKSFYMSNPDRLVLDIKNAKLSTAAGNDKASDSRYIQSVRYSQYAENTVRITVDMNASVTGTVSRSDSLTTAYLTFENSSAGGDGTVSGEDQAILDRYGLSAIRAEARQKLIVIDPGHGGSDTGSRGSENGRVVLEEKDLNLDIGLRVQKLLEAAGARLYMIRTADTTVPLYDRQDKANNLGASLYVAIHNNSYGNATPSGTEVLYYSKNQAVMDGISAYALAENLQKTLVKNLGLVDRGSKASPQLAVLRRTAMPAVIIEGAFLSNPGDLSFMKTDEFRELYAQSVAKCVIDALNSSVQ